MPPENAPDGDSDDESGDGTPRRGPTPWRQAPPALLLAAGLTLVEGLGTLVVAVTDVVTIDRDRLAMGATVGVFFVAYGALLVLCAWGLATVRPWARGPVLLAQLIWLGLAWNFRGGSTLPVAIALAVIAVATLAALLHPRSVDAVERAANRR